MSIRVLLLEDYVILRQALKDTLELDQEVSVVAEASTGQEALDLVDSTKPDVAVLDISLEGMDGIEVAERLRKMAPQVKILMLTIQSTSEHMYRAQKAGAIGYLLKDTAMDDVVEAVHAVAAGQTYFSRQVLEIRELGGDGTEPMVSPLESLTDREREVLSLLVNGRTNLEASKELKVSERTVEAARSRMMKKLHVKNIPALVKFALLHGLTTLDYRKAK